MLQGPPTLRPPLGISDFAELRAGGYTYVDKTGFIATVLGSDAKAQLFPRPRRFGKTLNLSTLRCFLERGGEDRGALFEDTAIWRQAAHRAHFQRHAVISLSFKDVKARTWADAWVQIRRGLARELRRLAARHGLATEDASDGAAFARLTADAGRPGDFVDYFTHVVPWLRHATGERCVLLIDEYDAPLHAAWLHGYWDDAIAFFRGFLSAGLKDQPGVFRGVLTGILKVAKEGIFSGLNNVRTFSTLTAAGAADFGFTEAEVDALAQRAGQADQRQGMRAWYDGYRFGGQAPQTLYNPWSVLSFLAAPEDGLRAHWRNTSANELIRDLLLRHAAAVGPEVARLLDGQAIQRRVDEDVALTELSADADALWSLLTASGYLTAEQVTPGPLGLECTLRIPNREVAGVYATTFARLLSGGRADGSVARLVTALLAGDAPAVERLLSHVLKTAMSYFDFGAKPIEAIYQAFTVGLLVHLDGTHRVRSNREAGYGRADVLVLPREPGPGAVLELKVADPDFGDTTQSALAEAEAQLIERDYAAEVRDAGATAVHQYAVVFDGKRCWVRAAS